MSGDADSVLKVRDLRRSTRRDARDGRSRVPRARRPISISAQIAMIAIALLCLTSLAAVMPMRGAPRIALSVESDVLVFAPAEVLDLVRSAAPPYGVHVDGRPWGGIEPVVPIPWTGADGVGAMLGGADVDVAAQAPMVEMLALRQLMVSPACEVQLEPWPNGELSMAIRTDVAPSPAAACSIEGTSVLRRLDRLLPAEPFGRVLDKGDVVRLRFQPRVPIHFGRIAVAGLGFIGQPHGEVVSTIRSGTLALPDHASRDTLYYGDALSLGELHGNLTGVEIGSTIRTTFSGTASRPGIAERQLRPSLLTSLYHSRTIHLVVVVIAAVLALVLAYYQVAAPPR